MTQEQDFPVLIVNSVNPVDNILNTSTSVVNGAMDRAAQRHPSLRTKAGLALATGALLFLTACSPGVPKDVQSIPPPSRPPIEIVQSVPVLPAEKEMKAILKAENPGIKKGIMEIDGVNHEFTVVQIDPRMILPLKSYPDTTLKIDFIRRITEGDTTHYDYKNLLAQFTLNGEGLKRLIDDELIQSQRRLVEEDDKTVELNMVNIPVLPAEGKNSKKLASILSAKGLSFIEIPGPATNVGLLRVRVGPTRDTRMMEQNVMLTDELGQIQIK